MTLASAAESTWNSPPSPSVDTAAAWESLLRGEWVVAEHRAVGVARRIVARAATRSLCPSAIRPRELEIARRRARGESIKAIRIELGCSDTQVHRDVASVMRKLKVSCQADLVALLYSRSPWGLVAGRTRLNPREGLVFRYPASPWAVPESLTATERGIAFDLVAGGSHHEIAKRRLTSARTVANQVASIFHKLGVHSRMELFAMLLPQHGAHGACRTPLTRVPGRPSPRRDRPC
jgi:DNA-binding NarL/FixJ family response regulator